MTIKLVDDCIGPRRSSHIKSYHSIQSDSLCMPQAPYLSYLPYYSSNKTNTAQKAHQIPIGLITLAEFAVPPPYLRTVIY